MSINYAKILFKISIKWSIIDELTIHMFYDSEFFLKVHALVYRLKKLSSKNEKKYWQQLAGTPLWFEEIFLLFDEVFVF